MAQPPEITLREGRDEDQPQIRALLADCPQAAAWADTYPLLIAEVGPHLAGFALYRVIAEEGELLNLAVHPNFRRQRIAQKLLLAIAPFASVWHLEVRQSNVPAVALYASLGLRQIGRRDRYYADGEAALLFSGAIARHRSTP